MLALNKLECLPMVVFSVQSN